MQRPGLKHFLLLAWIAPCAPRLAWAQTPAPASLDDQRREQAREVQALRQQQELIRQQQEEALRQRQEQQEAYRQQLQLQEQQRQQEQLEQQRAQQQQQQQYYRPRPLAGPSAPKATRHHRQAAAAKSVPALRGSANPTRSDIAVSPAAGISAQDGTPPLAALQTELDQAKRNTAVNGIEAAAPAVADETHSADDLALDKIQNEINRAKMAASARKTARPRHGSPEQVDNETHEAEQQRSAINAHEQTLTANFGDPQAGNPNGDVTVVEFYDPRCPYCRKMLPGIEDMLKKDHGIRLVYKDIPVLGPASTMETRAILAAHMQGGYLKMQAALMGDPAQPTAGMIHDVAKEVGLNPDKLAADMDSPATSARIKANMALAKSLKIIGTPTFVVGDQLIPGMVDVDDLAEAVAQARKHPG